MREVVPGYCPACVKEIQAFAVEVGRRPVVPAAMARHAPGEIAVIFTSTRTAEDEAGYAAAAQRMDALAAAQPGYLGLDSARDAEGFGITVSYWADEASALAWRAEAEHAATREAGRARWYTRYAVTVAEVRRGYEWERPRQGDN